MGGIDETLLVQYLLGKLSEEKQAQVEDRAFADAGYRAALEAVEADLIDDYVRGELPAADRGAFESLFLASPQRRTKVEFARALAALPAKPVPAPARSRSGLFDLFHGWSLPFRFAVAMAALLCVAGASWFLLHDANQKAAPQVAQKQKQAPAPVAIPARTPVVASLVLFAGLSRAEGAGPQLVLSPDAEVVNIQIQLDDRDDYAEFRAELRTSRGEKVMTSEKLTRRKMGSGFALSFDVPASVLKAGKYELALKGQPGGEPAEDVSYSYFTVQR